MIPPRGIIWLKLIPVLVHFIEGFAIKSKIISLVSEILQKFNFIIQAYYIEILG